MSIEATMTIGGEAVRSDNWVEVRNPAKLTSLVGRYPNGGVSHARDAISAAAAALPAWRATPPERRAALLRQAAGMIAERSEEWAPLLTAENGKCLNNSVIDFQLASMAIGYYSGHAEWLSEEVRDDARRRLRIQKHPFGVCAVIIPWNVPPALAATKIGPALLAGNTMVIKVPEFSPLATLEYLAAVAQAFPPGVLNAVAGFGPEVGSALVRDPRVRKITFTGSTEVGKIVMADAASHLARVTLELGGNDAALVLDDAKIDDEMISRVVTGAYFASGQICFAIKRLYVHDSRYDELVAKLRAAVDKLVVGDGMWPEVTMGPLNNERQFSKVKKLTADTKAAGHEVLELGAYAKGADVADGYFMLPHLVLNPPDSAAIVTCEQMGPILPVMKFGDIEDAIRRANDSIFGLASSVWSSDIDKAFAIGARLEAGTTYVNGHSLYSIDPDGPFGGVKESGIGYELGGAVGLNQYVQLKTITDNYFTG